ncbi:MAG: hypothetical protein ACR2IB_06505 [Pyrinomonadaceae bacterium]
MHILIIALFLPHRGRLTGAQSAMTLRWSGGALRSPTLREQTFRQILAVSYLAA